MYKHPGVYIEHVPSNMLSIEAASTSVAAFIGPVNRGTPVNDTHGGKPKFITNLGEYATEFGPDGGGPGGIWNMETQVDAFGHAVNAFFANGGTKAYIVPIAGTGATAGSATIRVTSNTEKFQAVFTATSPGDWSNALTVSIAASKLDDATPPVQVGDDVDVTVSNAGGVVESYTNVSLKSAAANFLGTAMNGVSSLLSVVVTTTAAVTQDLPTDKALTTGADGAAPGDSDYNEACEVLKDYRDVSIIVLPGLVWDTDKTKYQTVITHAEFMQNRMVIVDPKDSVLKTPVDVTGLQLTNSPYTALYYPHMTVTNPYYSAETAPGLPPTFDIAPSGFAAGMWARIDARRGVWKAPAGLEATVRGTLGAKTLVGNAVQDNLNELGVNCIRSITGPTVIWGARTLATKSKPQYRYVPVRRTQNMIGESLYNSLQAVVFEPNDHKLWSGLRASVSNFMDGLHRAGAFQGEKASDAYFVNCGLGSTMTQGDIDAGIVRVVVGFAPLKPAEFVVVQIQQIVGQTA